MATSDGWGEYTYELIKTKDIRNTKLARKMYANSIVESTEEWLTIEYIEKFTTTDLFKQVYCNKGDIIPVVQPASASVNNAVLTEHAPMNIQRFTVPVSGHYVITGTTAQRVK
jgi:hypothetical protein